MKYLQGASSLLLLLLLLLLLQTTSAQLSEREILSVFYGSLNGPNWKNNENWETAESHCNWHGISCNESGLVKRILLRENNLVGNVPDVIFELTELEEINFRDDQVQFSFEKVGKAVNLSHITLEECGMDVSGLDGISAGAGSITNLDLSRNGFDGTIPDEIWSLTKLRSLFLDRNSFIGTLSSSISQLSLLERIDLLGNKLSGPLPDLSKLTNVIDLGLSNNSFNGEIPKDAISQMTSIQGVFLHNQSGGGFTGGLWDFDGLENLKQVYLDDNSLSGPIPSNFLGGVASNVNVEVILNRNMLTGSIPTDLARFDSMVLEVWGNQFTGLSDDFCDKSEWMGGLVGSYKCDAILCPVGSFSTKGRQEDEDSECKSCPQNQFMGMTFCGPGPSTPTTPAPLSQPTTPKPLSISTPSPIAVPTPTPPTTGEAAQRQILKNLFIELNGNSWSKKDNWNNDSVSICDWFGIKCSDFYPASVVSINLMDNKLSGTVPSNIFDLPLQELNLRDNDVSFSFVGFEKATNLAHLVLANIQQIPSTAGVSSAKDTLTYLDISKNDIGGMIPEEIFTLTNLHTLFLDRNGYVGKIPSSIGNLSQLKALDLFGNLLSGTVPSSIGAFKNMEYFDMSENALSGSLPIPAIQQMPYLIELHLHSQVEKGGGFIGGINGLGPLNNIRELYLGNNNLTGTIPKDFMTNSTKTQGIHVSLKNNKLEGSVPGDTLSKFEYMHIDLDGNKITQIDQSLCSKSLWMGGNITNFDCDAILCPIGTWSASGKRTNSKTCTSCAFYSSTRYMGSNECSGTLLEQAERAILDDFYDESSGSSWTTQTNWRQKDVNICDWYGVTCTLNDDVETKVVQKLELANNNLQGTASSNIFTLSYLEDLILQGNSIEIDLSQTSSAMNLQKLDVSYTGLKKVDGISGASMLRNLDLSNNAISGTFPQEVFLLDKLTVLYMDNNHISGTFPEAIGSLKNLKSLDLWNNDMDGKIPLSLKMLTNIQDIDLSRNMFTGTIPVDAFQVMPNLWGLYLGGQKLRGHKGLTGKLPDFAGFSSILELDISDNNLTGTLPGTFLSDVPTNQVLKITLSNNQISGTIPAQLSRFDRVDLYMQDNKITGIAGEICQKSQWMGGTVGSYQCDAVLCPPGSSTVTGRQTGGTNGVCTPCYTGADHLIYYGATTCDPVSAYDSAKSILQKLYKSCGGAHWKRAKNWMNDNISICDWEGVGCHYSELVDSLSLGSNNVGGTFPREVFDLPALSYLWLYSNPVHFSFEGIENAKNLTSLHLDSTGLKSVVGLGNAPSLVDVDLRYNQIEGSFPLAEIGRLTSLENLALAKNKLTGTLPDNAFSNLKNLKKLILSSNKLGGTLPALDKLPSIYWVDLSGNLFYGDIPFNFLNSANLNSEIVIDVSNNRLSGMIPAELARFERANLYVKDNEFSYIDGILCTMEKWNDGAVGEFGCQAIACTRGSYSPDVGRQISYDEPCKICDSAVFIGSSTCSSAMSYFFSVSFALASAATAGALWLFI